MFCHNLGLKLPVCFKPRQWNLLNQADRILDRTCRSFYVFTVNIFSHRLSAQINSVLKSGVDDTCIWEYVTRHTGECLLLLIQNISTFRIS